MLKRVMNDAVLRGLHTRVHLGATENIHLQETCCPSASSLVHPQSCSLTCRASLMVDFQISALAQLDSTVEFFLSPLGSCSFMNSVLLSLYGYKMSDEYIILESQ